jgi:hypothetical protein
MVAIEAGTLSTVCRAGGYICATGTMTSLAESAVQHKINAIDMITNGAHVTKP